MTCRSFAAVVLASLAGISLSASRQGDSTLAHVRQVHERALASPFDETAFKAFLASLPRDEEYYVLEGDILATEPEVREYLVGRAGGASRAGIKPELLVNLDGGQPDYYADPSARTLAYYVDGTGWSESELQTVRAAMTRAAAAWQEACPSCGVAFTPSPAPLSNAETARGFVVRRADAQGRYVAAAFFPHDAPARRVLRVDRTFFTSGLDPVGVLRHELGHVLGYRHEHIRGIPGCGLEDNQWRPLTPYDPHSVMHYLCGGGGSLELTITPSDIAGHRVLYSPPRTNGSAALTPPRPNAAAQAMALFEAARKDPFNDEKRQAYLESLPRAGNYFIVEGDMRMAEDEVLEYLAASGQAERSTVRTPELLVGLHGGQPDFYPPGQRTLTYVVDRQTFPSAMQYDEAAQAVRQATLEWERLCHTCGVQFVPLDGGTAAAIPNFTVRYFDAGGEFIAAAFFPHDPPARRTVDLDPSFYTTTFDRVGVLRHELGHVLGYRHEHIRDIPGCYREDNQWRPLTPYDPRSVMHYFCGGGGTMTLEFTELDRSGHANLYALPGSSARPLPPGSVTAGTGAAPGAVAARPPAPGPSTSAGSASGAATSGATGSASSPQGTISPPTAPAPPAGAVLVVSLEGGNVVDNAAAVLTVLRRQRALPVTRHVVEPGETVEQIYRRELGLPSFSEAMIALATQLNGRDMSQAILRPGDRIVHPNVRFTEDTFGVRSDPTTIKRIEKKWDHLIVKPSGQQEDARQSQRVELRRFELRLPMAGEASAARAQRAIDGLKSRNILVAVDRPPQTKGPTYFSLAQQPTPVSTSGNPVPETPPRQPPVRTYDTLEQFAEKIPKVAFGEQGVVLSLLGPKAFKTAASCVQLVTCPDVVLVDKPVSVHPDLKGALSGDALDWADQNVALTKDQEVQLADETAWDETFHSTHLAGLIAARDNDFGLVGIDPAVKIEAWNWDVLVNQPSEFASRISRRQAAAASRGARQIYVFATGWPVGDYNDPVERYTNDMIAARFDRESALVVTSAGQAVPPAKPKMLDTHARLAPMNLGDRENVIVVTACGPCDSGAKLLPQANYSETFVHVAAPGVDVLSTVPGARYAKASGTSQAAAIAAGVVSAMLARYRDRLQEAYQVKTRLQVTSTPLEFLGADQREWRKLATGVIDPVVATLDPGADWIKESGGAWQPIAAPEHANGLNWIPISLVADLVTGHKIVPLEDVWRVMRNDDQWMIYVGSRRGPVTKIGPATFRAGELSKVLFRLNGREIRLTDLEDLLLRFPTSGQ